MASVPLVIAEASQPSLKGKTTPNTVKTLTDSSTLLSVPSTYIFTNPVEQAFSVDNHNPIPIINFSLLLGTPHQRSQAINDLAKACEDWGFFFVINHGIPENKIKATINGSREFFDLKEEEKEKYAGKHVLDPIRCGTSFNTSQEDVFFWRDFLKVFVHPQFHSPDKPAGFSELLFDYSKRVREVARILLEGISESLELEANYIEKTLNIEEGFQIFTANLYPPCPQTEHVLGMPPHSDHGLLTLLVENEIGGLQLQRNGKWVNANSIPNSFLVNIGDHLEILSNGKYKSVIHRAAVNNKATRISIAVAHGPSLDTVVAPAPELTNEDDRKPSYVGMQYREYLQLQQSNRLNNKSILERIRVVNHRCFHKLSNNIRN